MSALKNITFTLVLFLSLNTIAQNKRFVEEVAMYHLDSLTRSNADFKLVQYYTKGFMVAAKTGIKDTAADYKIKRNTNMASVFKDLTIVEKEKLINFPFTEAKQKNKNYTTLNIYHYLKIGDNYFVFFDIQRQFDGHNILLVMNSKGDLIRYKLEAYKN
ncbi:MAG: hypothetical protein IPJ32_17885 [Sphingobacteriaceae bacterium]|nr:hypothetical protein [Sphingobacteriaceae bacterium]